MPQLKDNECLSVGEPIFKAITRLPLAVFSDLFVSRFEAVSRSRGVLEILVHNRKSTS